MVSRRALPGLSRWFSEWGEPAHLFGTRSTALRDLCTRALQSGSNPVGTLPRPPRPRHAAETRGCSMAGGLVSVRRRRRRRSAQGCRHTRLDGAAGGRLSRTLAGDHQVMHCVLAGRHGLQLATLLQRALPCPACPRRCRSWKPRVQLFHHFLSDEECDHIIKAREPAMHRQSSAGS